MTGNMVNSNNMYVAVAEEIFPYNEDDKLQDLSKLFNYCKEQIAKMVRNLCHTGNFWRTNFI